MKYDTKALLSAAERAADVRTKFREDKHALDLRQWEADREAWLKVHGPQWQAEARYVLDCIRKGRAPQRNRMESLRSWGLRERPKMSEPWQEERTAVSLVALLKTVKDDEVSSAALERAGIRNFAWVLK